MKLFIYKFLGDNGQFGLVEATSRQEAIDKFNKQTGVPLWYIKDHFRIEKQFQCSNGKTSKYLFIDNIGE